MADAGHLLELPRGVVGGNEGISVLLDASEAAAANSLDLDALLREMARIVRRIVDYEMYCVLLPQESGDLRIAHAEGLPEDLVKTLRVRPGQGLTGFAAMTRRTVSADDVDREPRYLRGVASVRSEVAVPLVARDRVVAVVDLQSADPAAFDSRVSDLLELVASRFSLAIDVAQLYAAKEKQRAKLETLHRVAEEYSTLLSLDELLHKIAALVRRLIPYDAFAIYLKDPQGPYLRHYLGVKFDESVRWSDLRIGDGLVGQAAATREPVLVKNTANDPRYIEFMAEIQSEVAVPLLLKGKLVGVLDLESVSEARFGKDDLATLTLLAPQCAAAIENARLHEETARNEARMAADLVAARALQYHLLPSAPMSVEGLEVAARNAPAAVVSGDLFDFYREAGWFGILNADVSGKGAAAAIYAALASGLFRSFAEPNRSPGATLASVNQALLDRKIEAKFVAASFASWRANDRVLEIASAGMPFPFVIRDGKARQVAIEGIPLGMFRNTTYDSTTLKLRSGDVVLCVSDGFGETVNSRGDSYAERRILEILHAHWERPALEILDELFQDVAAFDAEAEPSDDRTAIVMRVRD